MKRNRADLTEEEWNLLSRLEQMPEDEIDTEDIPEVLEVRNPRRDSLLPRNTNTVSVSVDQDIIAWWKAVTGGKEKLDHWVNDIVRSHISQEKGSQEPKP